jgi:hypothetical protein
MVYNAVHCLDSCGGCARRIAERGAMVPFVVLLGMIAILFGVGAIAFGIPNNAFGFGNTMITAGATAVSAGFIVLALATVLRAIERIGRAPAASAEAVALPEPADQAAARQRPPMPAAPPLAPRAVEAPLGAHPPSPAQREEGSRTPASRPAPPLRGERAPVPGARPPVRAGQPREPVPELPRDVVESPLPVAARNLAPIPAAAAEPAVAAPGREAAAPVPPPERRRFFAWTRRSAAREPAQLPPEPKVAPAAPHPGPSFGDVDPSAEAAHWADHGVDREVRQEPPPPDRAGASRQPQHGQETHVEVLKSGIVDGMAYTLYSDGSIDAEFPDGKLRFASIDELCRHLEGQG